jgi:hydroxyethylthiazole kinase
VGLAAEAAAAACAGPGTFAAAWVDALDAVTPEDLLRAQLRDQS